MSQRLSSIGLGVPEKQLRRFNRQTVPTSHVPMTEVPQTGQNLQRMATTLIEAFNDHRVELFDDTNLRRDLTRFRIEERAYGFRLVSPRDEHGHGDTGSAFTLAMLAASELAGKKKPFVAGPLTNYTVDTDSVSGTPSVAQFFREQEERKQRMQKLTKGSYNYSGMEGWDTIMRYCGRK